MLAGEVQGLNGNSMKTIAGLSCLSRTRRLSTLPGIMGRAILLMLALLVVGVGCGKKSGNLTPRKTMSHTLDVCGSKKVRNPSEADIRAAVSALDTAKGEAFLILGPTNMTYIQTGGDRKIGFDLEYQENDAKHHYRAKRNFTDEEIVKVLICYMTGGDDWKKTADWERIEW
jgi:hypothetical protein